MVVLLLAACAGPTDATPPPGPRPAPGLTLTAPASSSSGMIPLRVGGAAPFSQVHLFRSERGEAPGGCVAPRCLDLVAPTVEAWVWADAFGEATWVVPNDGRPRTVWFQAVGGAPSPVAAVDVLPPGVDRDGDGLSDLDEARVWRTDPGTPDTDGDRAADAIELHRGSDPRTPDTDGDGLADGVDLHPAHAVAQDAFQPTDEATGLFATDPEFDAATERVAWQDKDGRALWVADVDPLTGDLVPPDGRGVRVDVRVEPIAYALNGPEFAQTANGSELLYHVRVGADVRLARAWETPVGWVTVDVPGTERARTAYTTQTPGDPRPAVWYYRATGLGGTTLWWRELDDATTEERLQPPLRRPRWIADTRAIIGAGPAHPHRQVWVHDLDAGRAVPLTDDSEEHVLAVLVADPERGGERVLITTAGTSPDRPEHIWVHRDTGSGWAPVRRIEPPPAYPLIVSLEPFVWDGRLYVSYAVTASGDEVSNGDAQIWLAAVSPSSDLVRRVSRTDAVSRRDPEPYLGGSRPWIYYTLVDGRSRVRRCELGL